MRIYIAGPYSHPDPAVREQHVARAMQAGLGLLQAGHAPVIPHLNHYFDEWVVKQGIALSYEQYMRWDAALLEVCDGMLFLGSSPGADRELELAVRLGKPIVSRLSGGHW